MSLTRQEKEGVVKEATELLKKSNGVIFTEAIGVSTSAIRSLRTQLKAAGATYKVIKRTLTRIAFRSLGVTAGAKIARTSISLVFLPDDLPAISKILYEFSKKEKNFKILNAYDVAEKRWLAGEEVLVLAKLPSRQDLLTQLAYVLKAPMKRFAFVVNQVAQQKS